MTLCWRTCSAAVELTYGTARTRRRRPSRRGWVPPTIGRKDAGLVFQGTEPLDDTGWQHRKSEETGMALK